MSSPSPSQHLGHETEPRQPSPRHLFSKRISSAKVLDLWECQRFWPTFSGYPSASLSSSSGTTWHTGGEAHVEYAGECSWRSSS
jgi:hypothetical protein